MQSRRNYYRVLHVQPDAPVEIIRASHRTLMQVLRMHPDLGGEHRNATAINEAFDTLGDPMKRAAYDRLLARGAATSRRGTPASPAPGVPHACLFCGAGHAPGDAERQNATCALCKSPLYRTTRPAHAVSRRALAFMPRRAPVVICVAWPAGQVVEGVSEDVSVSGMRIVTTAPLTQNCLIRLDCDFCSAVAIVRHVNGQGPAEARQWRAGLEFLTLRIRRRRGVFVSADA